MRNTVLLILAITLAAAATAGVEVQVLKFEFDGEAGPVGVELNSETMGFTLDELQPGETRSTTSEDGTPVTLTRNDETIALQVAGQLFEIPASHGPMHGAHEMGSHKVMMAHMDDGLMIIGSGLDETRQATIRDALAAAGITGEIHFVSPGLSMEGGEMIVEKEIYGDGENIEKKVIIKRMIED